MSARVRRLAHCLTRVLVARAALAPLLAAALPLILSTPAAAQTTTTAPDCASTTAPITGRMSVSTTTPAQALSDQGFCNGIEFTADGVVNVAEAARNRIGTSTIPANPAADRRAVSVRTGAAATGNPDGRGTLNFSVDATVEGRVGDALTEANADDTTRRIFKATPSGRLKLIRIGSSGSMATPTVTFTTPPKGFVFDRTTSISAELSRLVRVAIGVGGVGAKQLQFETDGTVVLAAQIGQGFPIHYAIDQVLTQTNGQGALTFKANNGAVFQGTIGAQGKKLNNVTLNSDLLSNPIITILGHIYANTIWLNTRTMRVGANPSGFLRLSGSGFDTTQPAEPYIVDADIKTRFNTRGSLEIDVDTNYELRGQIGMNGSELINVNLQPNARAIVHKDIYSEDVYIYSNSTLTVQKPNLTIAGRLTAYNRSSVSRGLSDIIIRGGTTLDLGNHTLSVKGAVAFTNDAPGNPHTLSLTLDGAGSGQLDASAGGVRLSSSSGKLVDIKVNVPDPSSIANGQSFTLIKGKASFSTSLSQINLITPANSPLDFALSAPGNDLVLTATRRRAAQSTLSMAADDRGDLALVPYYTVAGDWVTGLHIVNTSKRTQVVKVRLRRATDAMDALNFNVVLSPHDVYAGFLSDDEQGVIAWTSPDSSCTAPATQNNRLALPATYAAGAETGYIEVIAMGSPSNERQPLARAARHAAGSTAGAPLDCAAVRSNFFADGAGTGAATRRQGVQDRFTTWQAASPAAGIQAGGLNTYDDSGNVLKVSYFIRDNATGIEFGDNAVHIRDFLANPALSNQQYGVFAGDLNGFDFPDLNGGVPLKKVGNDATSVQRGRFNALRAPEALGVGRMVNEWSANPANGVEMNWVVTLPGQYVMLKLPQYLAALASTSSATGTGRPWAPTLSSADHQPLTNPACPRDPVAPRAGAAAVADCDYRDMPVELTFTAYTREEGTETAAPGSLVVSPAPPGARPKTYLPKAVNVITFGRSRVFGGGDADVSAPNLGQPYGWVSARVTSRDTDLQVCDWDFNDDISAGFGAAAGAALKDKLVCSAVTPDSAVPVIGFAAWSRKVAANPDASYGRIVEHSYRAQ